MSLDEILVTKRDSTSQTFDIDKINKILGWATDEIKNVSSSDIVLNASFNINNGIRTKDIHSVLIDASLNCFSEEFPNYQFVASRLLNFSLRKEVWNGIDPPSFYDFILENVNGNYYHKEILDLYSKEEIEELEKSIDHDRDFKFTYAGIKQLIDKYLVQDRKTKKVFETPQFAYMLISMIGFSRYDKSIRLSYVKNMYDIFSLHKANLPTPQMAGIRTPLKSYASCMLIESDDTLDSIFATNTAIGLATSNRYGIGLNIGKIRGIGSSVKNGSVIHTGIIPYLKMYMTTTKSCQQNGLRGGGGTIACPWWHLEIEDYLALKNNGGTEDNRARSFDYSVNFDKLFLQRVIDNEYVTLFSPNEVPDLVDSHGLDNFDSIYLKYEKNTKSTTMKKRVKARHIISEWLKERVETGRIYALFVDLVNQHCSWKEQIRQSNLCQEVVQPTNPLSYLDDPNGEIGICTLGAINIYEIKNDEEHEHVCEYQVRFLEETLDLQEYFLPAARNFAINRRSLGIGITNLAGWLAKNGYKYTDKNTPNFVAEMFEKQQFYLLKASLQLSKEKGPAPKFHLTKYSDGILPIDTYKKDIDSVITQPLAMDWEWLRAEIKEHGLRHSTCSCEMPVESCLKWDTRVKLENGYMNFREILEKDGLDYENIEKQDLIGWHQLNTPIKLVTQYGIKETDKIYYNGYKETYDLELEDGTIIKATANHKFLIKTESGQIWKKVIDLKEDDEIVTL